MSPRYRVNDRAHWEIILAEYFEAGSWRVLLRNVEFIL